MRVTQDAIPGMVIPAHFTPMKIGHLPDQLRPTLRHRPLHHERHHQSRFPGRLRQMGRRQIQGRRAARAAATNRSANLVRTTKWNGWFGAALLVTHSRPSWPPFVVHPAPAPSPCPIYGALPDFALTDQNNQTVTLGLAARQVWIADVIFTRCAGQCLDHVRAHEGNPGRPARRRCPSNWFPSPPTPAYDTPPFCKNMAPVSARGTADGYF